MAIISESLLEKAKNRAIDHLEFNIAKIALALNVNLDELNSSFDIPVDQEDINYSAYFALKQMCVSLEALQ